MNEVYPNIKPNFSTSKIMKKNIDLRGICFQKLQAFCNFPQKTCQFLTASNHEKQNIVHVLEKRILIFNFRFFKSI